MQKPIRVLQVVAGMDCGGIENFIMNVYRCMDRSKVQFDFLYHTGKPCFFDEEIQKLGGRIYRFPMNEGVRFLAYFRFLEAFFKNHSYAVLHGHYSLFGLFYDYFARRHGVLVRVGHSHTTGFLGTGFNQLADRLLSPAWRFGLTHRFACSRAAGQHMFGKKEFSVYQNGIQLSRFRYNPEQRKRIREKYGVPETAAVLGCVGQFRAEKNHSWLLERFAELCKKYPQKEFWLLLVGDGTERGRLESQVQSLKIPHVIFTGQQDSAPFYSAMDLFVLPSRFEGLGIVAIEAQANGLDCLLSAGVPQEAAVTKNVSFLPLEKKNAEWERRMAAVSVGHRSQTEEEIQAAGYDIELTAQKLQEFYLSAAERGKKTP